MKKWLLGLVLIFYISSLPAYSVEFGVDATGDPNAISVGGASGFLYSDRIVFTAAHIVVGVGETTLEDMSKQIDIWEGNQFVYAPGIGNRIGQKQYKVKRVLIAPTYRSRVGNDHTRVDDFAILILQESIPMNNRVVIASNDDMATFIEEKTSVYMVGYGLQNPSQRTPPLYGTLSPRKMTSFLVSNEELKNYYRNNADRVRQNQTILNYGIPNSKDFGSVCDGDSGAGFFVERGEIRYYLGPVGGQQAGIPNCQIESMANFGIGGGMSGITATNKFLPLIREAELIVAEDKDKEFKRSEELRIAAEIKAQKEAEAKAKAEAAKKKTITCTNGKKTKKVKGANPKCPKGYKKK